ncbi:MAG TPA: TetR/AcrR family transcriptional regulator [Actinocrinis sp.]|nr:TetR/AcrR family transcriptional regulator [Actinocrinis sp.]
MARTIETKTADRSAPGPRRSARERLLASANELFYAEGVQSVGIDRIIEHAGVAKASLYNQFGSKEELVQAYLQHRHAGTTGRLEAAINAHEDPRDRLLSVFEAQGRLFQHPGFNGCAFMSASAEAAPGGLVQAAADEFRAWIRAMFTDLARAAGAPDPARLARQLHLIYDGAIMTARLDRDPSIAAEARSAAAALLDAALASGA